MATVVIVSGGEGLRMNSDIRKQYINLCGKPILSYTIDIFAQIKEIEKIILVIPFDDFNFCKKKILPFLKFQKEIILVKGGKKRQESVYNGLSAYNGKNEIVVIHDGVRPFVKPYHIRACILNAKKYKACILATPVFDTLKKNDETNTIIKTINRNLVYMAQTPQAFQYSIIKKAHNYAIKNRIFGTDDASLLEIIGKEVKIIEGSIFNIKITKEEDLLLAKAIINIEN